MFKKEKIKDLHYSVNGLIPAADLQAAADEILLEYGKKAKMPGFRAGKIPLSILVHQFIDCFAICRCIVFLAQDR